MIHAWCVSKTGHCFALLPSHVLARTCFLLKLGITSWAVPFVKVLQSPPLHLPFLFCQVETKRGAPFPPRIYPPSLCHGLRNKSQYPNLNHGREFHHNPQFVLVNSLSLPRNHNRCPDFYLLRSGEKHPNSALTHLK